MVDWSKVDKEDYLLAMERSPIKDIEIKFLLKNALTDNVNDREIYMKGIDHSYYYEGYYVFKTEDLNRSISGLILDKSVNRLSATKLEENGCGIFQLPKQQKNGIFRKMSKCLKL